jgi:hypothetical protein
MARRTTKVHPKGGGDLDSANDRRGLGAWAVTAALLVHLAAGCAARPEAAPPVPWGLRGAEGLAYQEPDHDQDGVDNVWDRCPDLPEDPDGHRDDDGCPDPDNDGDGIADAKDDDP